MTMSNCKTQYQQIIMKQNYVLEGVRTEVQETCAYRGQIRKQILKL